MSDGDKHTVRVQLPIRRTAVLAGDALREVGASVHCPVSASAREITGCASCTRLKRADKAALECEVPAACEASSGALICNGVACLDGELPAARALEVLERVGESAAPVVDDNGVLLGMVTTAGLSAALQGRHGEEVEVEDVMTPAPALHDHAPIDEAIDLMARFSVERLPLVDARGRLVGLLTALDLLRWLTGGAAARAGRR